LSYPKDLTQTPWAWSLILLVALTPLAGRAQVDPSTQPTPDSVDQSTSGSPQPDQTAPAPAFGAGVTTPSAYENPPISGLDQPSLEPGTVSRSFLAAGAILSESGDSNISGTFDSANQSTVGGVTRAMGSIALQKIWSRSETDLQYIGGGIFYEGVPRDTTQIQQADLAQRFRWRTGQFVLRDGLSYLPEGNFGAGSYGGSGALLSGLAGLGTGTSGLSSGVDDSSGGTLSANQFGSAGQSPRLTNTAAADLVQAINPRSTFTMAGSYGFVHFTNNQFGLIDSDQAAAQVGYDRQINRANQIAVTYGFQNIHFPQVTGSSLTTNTVHFLYGHRINGRIDFIVAAGPQFTHIQNPVLGSSTGVSVSGNARLRYRFQRASMELEYRHYNTNGSGYFLGSITDLGTVSVSRPLGRVWEANSGIGIANNKRLESTSVVTSATSDRYIFAGAAVHRHVGRRYRLFLSYQYSRFAFNNTVCLASANCGTSSDRHMGVVGVEWYPRPVRLD
jgi:hypothetical protein